MSTSAAPEVSIVVPALNEEANIGEFIDWCHEGIRNAGVVGEILIIDSSTDRTAEIAESKGARVLRTPRRGLGRAYIDALPEIRGRFVIMGDCDCTYDFRELKPFLERFREGNQFVMGSRFLGFIEPGAMPPLHQYFGTPLTTWILNFIFSSRFSDIHCGMRGLSKEALTRMDLQSQSWEYASEVVVKAVQMRLKTAEVPIRFYKDRRGRVSHHKRSGWASPWLAGWINLRVMFVYGANFFLFKPGLVLVAVGLLFTLPLVGGPVTIGPITFSLHWMLAGVSILILGLQSVFMGVIVQVLVDSMGRITERWLATFRYTRSTLISFALFGCGLLMTTSLLRQYITGEFKLYGVERASYLAVAGLTLMIAAFMNFTFTLVLHACVLSKRRRG